VIGINAAHLPPTESGAENVGFAISVVTATSVADQLIEDGDASHPDLGLSVTNLTPQVAGQFNIPVEVGALVTRADPEGPEGRLE
jgi:S1-C subfamily serine protease